MKEKLYTIPLMEAFRAEDECPFCYIERQLEKDALDFTLGSSSSYMESDIREQTDEMGFCRDHFKKMYKYGNSLGNALILKTHFKKTNLELAKQLKDYKPDKSGMFGKFMKNKEETATDKIASWVAGKETTCFVCDHMKNTYDRYVDTFFHLFKNTPEFKEVIKNSKGFCLHHFGEVTSYASEKLNDEQREEYANLIFPLMIENMNRLEEDISWLVDKYDYRNADADWKNSKDALQRGMQKIKGGYPSENDYQGNR
jgi:sulfur relay (sulfurtransferase) DsrC/TusE family protein